MSDETTEYDFSVAWNWDGDKDLIFLISEACKIENIKFLEVTPENLDLILKLLIEKKIFFHSFFDRASDTDKKLNPLIQWVKDNHIYFINFDDLAKRASDKSIMHEEFKKNGIKTPDTIILPSFNTEPEVEKQDLTALGNKFIIKPACGGGGAGVVIDADSWDKVLSSRKQYPDDKYLLQATIIPKQIDSWTFWFRVIYCNKVIFPFRWVPHIYTEVTLDEEEKFILADLRKITNAIADICKLDLFSTEIAVTIKDEFFAVDYVNDQIDLRLKSKNHESVPDEVVHKIVGQIISLVKK